MNNSLALISPQQGIQQAKANYDIVSVLLRDKVLRPGIDFGVIPGTKKPSLWKPGSERLCAAFGLSPVFEVIDKVERWDGDAPMFHYNIRCRLVQIGTGYEVATGLGSCNSMESKYRYRWIYESEVKDLGLDPVGMVKKQNNGKNNSKYWTYRVDNDDIFTLVNTIEKMACKRALIAAVLIGANASEFFTQDIEDLRDFGSMDVIEAEYEEITTTTTPELKVVEKPTAPSNVDPETGEIIEGSQPATPKKERRIGAPAQPEPAKGGENLTWDGSNVLPGFLIRMRQATGMKTADFSYFGGLAEIESPGVLQSWAQKFPGGQQDAIAAVKAAHDAQPADA